MPGCRRSGSLRRRVNADCGPVPRNPANRLVRRPAVPLLQKQGFFPPKSRASNRQWAAWVLATRLGSYCAIMFFHQSAVKKTFDEREARAGHGPD
jgi:hypothetical protein